MLGIRMGKKYIRTYGRNSKDLERSRGTHNGQRAVRIAPETHETRWSFRFEQEKFHVRRSRAEEGRVHGKKNCVFFL